MAGRPLRRLRNAADRSMIEVLVAAPRAAWGAVKDAAWDTAIRYNLIGVSFRYTTEGDSPAVAVQFRFDPLQSDMGGSAAAIRDAFEVFLERRLKHKDSTGVFVVGQSLSATRRNAADPSKDAFFGEHENGYEDWLASAAVKALIDATQAQFEAERRRKAQFRASKAKREAERRLLGSLASLSEAERRRMHASDVAFEKKHGMSKSAAFISGLKRRNPSEGERHISYEEQERRRKLYAPSREKEAERRRLRAALAILAEADLEAGRVAEARKKGASARPPKPVYTKEYLKSKGMKRRNPLDAYRKQSLDGEVYFSVPFANHMATLDVQFSETDWSRPGAPKTLRVLRTSHMAQRPQHGDLGHYGTLVRRLADAGPLTSDDLLNAAISAEEAAERMFTSYPQYRYRDAAHYYEGLAEVLTDLASSLQAGWRTNGKRR